LIQPSAVPVGALEIASLGLVGAVSAGRAGLLPLRGVEHVLFPDAPATSGTEERGQFDGMLRSQPANKLGDVWPPGSVRSVRMCLRGVRLLSGGLRRGRLAGLALWPGCGRHLAGGFATGAFVASDPVVVDDCELYAYLDGLVLLHHD